MSDKFFFLTSIRNPSNLSDKDHATQLLNQTILSVLNQTHENVSLVVVCNEIPYEAIRHESIVYHIVETSTPCLQGSKEANLMAGRRDKGVKLLLGLKLIQKENPHYVFIIDSDDWIHKNIANYVMQRKSINFWYIDQGYLVNEKENLRTRKSGLCRYCGTAFIYNFDKIISMIGIKKLPFDIDENGVEDLVDPFIYQTLFGTHRFQFSYLRKRGYSLKSIPFPAVCWVVNTGENLSQKTMSCYGFPFTTKFLKNYGIEGNENSSVRIKYLSKSIVDSFLSRIGWAFTNTNKEKV